MSRSFNSFQSRLQAIENLRNNQERANPCEGDLKPIIPRIRFWDSDGFTLQYLPLTKKTLVKRDLNHETLTTEQITSITSQKSTLETSITQLVSMREVLQTKVESISGTTANPVQITSGSQEATTETATIALLMEMKQLTMTSKAIKNGVKCQS